MSVGGEQSSPHVSEARDGVSVHGSFESVLCCVGSHTLLGRTWTSCTVGVRAGERGDVNPPPRYLTPGKGTTVKLACCDDVTRDVEAPGIRVYVL